MQNEIFINGLRFIVADSYKEMSKYSAEEIFKDIKKKKNLLICTATGSTPTGTYNLLAKKYSEEPEAFSNVRYIKLDEWGGIPMDDPATCEVYLQEHLISPLQIEPSRYISWNSLPEDPDQEVERISQMFANENDIDLCLLGLGANGHIAFNEPAKFLHRGAHVAELAETTKNNAMAQKSKHNIQYGLTLGMQNIMRSKKILFLVNGTHKQEPFKKFLTGKITTRFPATMLWMHPNVTVICDKEVIRTVRYLRVS